MLEKDLWEYFILNGIDDISLGSLWGGEYKAVIIGKLIQLGSQPKQERQADIAKLEKEFKLLSKDHKQHPTNTSLANLEEVKLALNLGL